MNSLTNLFSMPWPQLWELLGWTMCYFLAAGTVLALAGAAVRLICSRLGPQFRYAISLGTFAALAALPIGIACWLAQSSTPAANSSSAIVSPVTADPLLSASPTGPTIDLKDHTLPVSTELQPEQVAAARTATNEIPVKPEIHQDPGFAIDAAIRWLPWVWLVGAPLTFLFLTTGLIGSQRLRKQSNLLAEGPIYDACTRLRSTLAISQRVGIAISERITSPLLIGIVRPVILLPPAALTGWSPEEIEMVLLHELAHVRRWDNLVNFLQRVVESLLFFHPAVWWVSGWVRHDREECCDTVVVSRTARPTAYAELLVALATPQSPLAGLAMAQHPLTGRIRRILKIEDEKMLVSRGTITLAGTALAGLLAAILWTPIETTVAEEPIAIAEAEEELTTEDAESAEELTSIAGYGIARKLDFVGSGSVELPSQLQSTEHHQRILDSLKDQGFSGEIEGIRIAGGRTLYLLTITTPGYNTPGNLVWEEHQDGLRPRVIIQKTTEDSTENEGVPSTSRITPAPPAVFLSLEDQRAADLAYKLLDTELGQLGDDELKRVKAKEFAGGLLVTDIKASSTQGETPNLLRKGDLLVGLHVWPTTSLADVRKILERDDIAELSPLKFYVIRTANQRSRGGGRGGFGGEYGGGYGGGYGGEFGGGYGGVQKSESVDELVTGRISVNVKAIRKPVTVPGYVPPVVSPATSGWTYPASPRPTIALGQTMTPLNPVPAGSPLGDRAKPTLLFFCDPKNSAPCRKMQPIVRQLAKEMKKQIDVVEIDVSQSAGMAEAYQVKYIPSYLLFQHNKMIGAYKGEPELAKLKEFITTTAKPASRAPYSATPRQPATLTPYNLAPGDQIKILVTGAYPDQPIADVYTIEDMGTVALGPTYGRIKVAGLTVLEAEKKIKQQLSKILTDIAVQVTVVQKSASVRSSAGNMLRYQQAASRTNRSQLADLQTQLEQEKLAADVAENELKRKQELFDSGVLSQLHLQKSNAEARHAKLQVQRLQAKIKDLQQESTRLLYDNRTFHEWRSLWKNELKTEKRTEAIKALAAFGRAGYGREAAEAILDVAGQYDFRKVGSSQEKLYESIQGALYRSIPTELWLPILLERYQADPTTWAWFTTESFDLLQLNSPESAARRTLLELANGRQEVLRRAAIGALARAPADDPQVVELVELLIRSENPHDIKMGIRLLKADRASYDEAGSASRSKIRSIPALTNALTHPIKNVRGTSRYKLQSLSNEESTQIVAALLERLDKVEDEQEVVAIVRALAAIGKQAAVAESRLQELVQQTESKSLGTSVFAALDIIVPLDQDEKEPLLSKLAGVDWKRINEKSLSDKQRLEISKAYELAEQNCEHEKSVIFPNHPDHFKNNSPY